MCSVGLNMAFCKQNNHPQPDITKGIPNSPKSYGHIKELIKAMTEYEPQERMKMSEVEERLKALGGI